MMNEPGTASPASVNALNPQSICSSPERGKIAASGARIHPGKRRHRQSAARKPAVPCMSPSTDNALPRALCRKGIHARCSPSTPRYPSAVPALRPRSTVGRAFMPDTLFSTSRHSSALRMKGIEPEGLSCEKPRAPCAGFDGFSRATASVLVSASSLHGHRHALPCAPFCPGCPSLP